MWIAVVAALAVVATAAAAPQPRLTSATVVGDRVTLTFDTGVAASARGTLNVTVNGRVVPARRLRGSGRRLGVVLGRAVHGDDVVRVHGRNLRARDGRRIRLFATAVENRSAPGCTYEPDVPVDATAPRGTFDVLSVQVDFADAPAGVGINGYAPMRLDALDTWTRDLSYGRAAVAGTLHPVTVRMPKNSIDYRHNGAWGDRKPFFQDLVLRLDREVDFTRYDAVFVAMTRKPRDDSFSPDRLALAPRGTGVVADGVELRRFASFLHASPPRGITSVLELMGLSVSYDAGVWQGALAEGLASGRYGLLAHHRRQLGWIDAAQTRCLDRGALDVTLSPVSRSGGTKLVVVRLSPSRSLVLENRQPFGLDAEHCRRGILVYEVERGRARGPRTLPRDRTPLVDCGYLAQAPYDFRPKDSTTVADVTFEVLDVLADGSYRVRVSR